MEPAIGVLHKATVMDVLTVALAAADPYRAVLKALATHPDALQSLAQLAPEGNIYVVGAGKAGAAMARAAEDALGERISVGLVIVKDERSDPNERPNTKDEGSPPQSAIRIVAASHPVPDSRGVAATEELISLVEGAGEGDLVVCLISGGGSALLALPAEGIGLEDVQVVTEMLLRAGATISELNAVRKHLSRVSGGQLARIASPARVLSLVLSDVAGSPLDVIASGPTAPDPTTFADALAILTRRTKGGGGTMNTVPACLLDRLRSGAAGGIPETPKPGDPLFANVTNLVVASNVLAVEAAATRAEALGFNTAVISTYLEGEARVVGQVLAGIAREVIEHNRPLACPACLLFGGETTVTVRGDGVGGRNTELAMSSALALDGLGPNAVVVSLATDGGDGISPSAGAMVDGTTIERGRVMGLDAQESLDNNDSYTYLSSVADAIMLGPTGTNANDIMAIFVF